MAKKISRKTPSPVDIYIGDRIRARRMQIGMSQTTLGKALGVTFQQVQKYEKGVNRVGGSRMQQIANALNVSVTWFYEGAPGNSSTGPKSLEAVYTKFLTEQGGMPLMEAWPKLTKAERRAIANLVETLASQA